MNSKTIKKSSKLIGGCLRTDHYNYNIQHGPESKTLDDINQFVDILKDYFWFDDDIKDRMKWMAKELWYGHYHEFWNGKPWECFTIAAMSVAHDERGKVFMGDIPYFCKSLFKPEDYEEGMIKLNEAYNQIVSLLDLEDKIDIERNIACMDKSFFEDYY
jgi:hypothetical protein